ncbi:SDR family NAD(P)-dependent oxidoreductase [Streptomyces sp. JNUCC 63]
MHSLQGKVALVTGGASGIGAGICHRFVDAGAFVVVADVDEERGRELAEELGDAAVFRRVDVTREEDIAAAVTDTAATRGRLDCLVNNAGRVGSWRFAEDIPPTSGTKSSGCCAAAPSSASSTRPGSCATTAAAAL